MRHPGDRPAIGAVAWVTAASVLLMAGCAGLPTADLDQLDDRPAVVELEQVPFHDQPDYHCGPASLLTALEASGAAPSFEQVTERVYVPGLRGSLQAEMAAAARNFGRIPFVLPGHLEAVLDQVEAGYPVLVLQNLGLQAVPIWHYAVVIGYDRKRNRILMRSGNEPNLATPAGRWLRQWHRAGRWALVVLEPGRMPASPDRDRTFRALADFEPLATPGQRLAAWTAAAEHWPNDPVAWLGVGNAAHLNEDDATAIQAFQRALDQDPGHLPARLNLAHLLNSEGQPCRALEVLSAAQAEPDHPLAGRVHDLDRRLRTACNREPG